MSKSTMVELVAELEKVPRTPLIDQIIAEAKAGEFHDYKNQKYICGKVAANELLTRAGLTELARQIRSGEYDERPDAEDDVMIAGIIAGIMQELIRGKNDARFS